MLGLEILIVALTSLRTNLMRSMLTMLGVIIGVAAVITMVALGEGAQASVRDQLAGLGANRLTVRAGSSFSRGFSHRGVQMKVEDAYAVQQKATSIEAVVPSLSRNNVQVEWKNTQGTSSITGTWAEYLRMENWPLASGRFFTPTEQEGHRRVAVLGSEAATTIFPPNIDPIGEELRIQSVAFEVIGVMGEKGGSSFFSRDNGCSVPS